MSNPDGARVNYKTVPQKEMLKRYASGVPGNDPGSWVPESFGFYRHTFGKK